MNNPIPEISSTSLYITGYELGIKTRNAVIERIFGCKDELLENILNVLEKQRLTILWRK